MAWKTAKKTQPKNDRPDNDRGGQKLLHCPWAEQWTPEMRTKGTFRKGYPEGAIVHFTAGRPGPGTISYGTKMGYAFWHIDRDGTLRDTHPLNRYGAHGGVSAWKGLGSDVSRFLLGIEISTAGRVEKKSDGNFETYFGTTLSPDEVRLVPSNNDNQLKGWYHKYTEAQEKTLIELLLWLKWNNPEVFSFDLVLGHDEVAGPKGIGRWRKNDPGGALSMTMTEFRALLKKLYEERHGKG